MHSFLISVLGIFSFLSTTAYSSILKTTINAGRVQGAKCPTTDATAFKSVPFAQPPLGELRFAAPQPFQGKFNGSFLNATTPAPSCIQFGSSYIEPGPTSEDCLYLDIWVPPTATLSSGLPVKVWVYGGAETAGGISDVMFDGCHVAIDGSLLVLINYRLGPLGFMALDTAGVQGNQAIQDILLGLQWVQDNIAAFGGNPKDVVLFGQSAGAGNSFIVSTLPQAPKLIKAAILESGGGWSSPPTAAVQAFGAKYAKALNCSVYDVSCIRNVPASVLNSTLPPSTVVGIDSSPVSYFVPYVDGIIVKDQPSTIGVQVPAIFGSTSMEGTSFILGKYGKGFTSLTNDDYLSFLSTQFAPSIVPLITKQFPISLFNSTPYPAFYAMSNVVTDAGFKCPAYRGLTTAIQKGIPAYTYLDAHTPSCEWISGVPSESLKLLGATHTAELLLVFSRLTGLGNGTCNLSTAEGEMSKTLVDAWTAMALTGNPSTSSFQWPQFSLEKSQGVVINETAAVGVVDYTVCEFWDKIDALSFQLGIGSGAGNFSANGTSTGKTGGGFTTATGSSKSSGSTTSPLAFTGGASGTTASIMVYLAGVLAALIYAL